MSNQFDIKFGYLKCNMITQNSSFHSFMINELNFEVNVSCNCITFLFEN